MTAQKDLPDTVPREATGHHACDTDAGKCTDLRRVHSKLSTGTLSRDKECGQGMNGGSDAALYTFLFIWIQKAKFYAEISSERNMEMSPANYPKTFALLTPKYFFCGRDIPGVLLYIMRVKYLGGTIPSCCVVFVGFHWISMNQNPELLAEETKEKRLKTPEREEMQKVTNLEKKRALFF